MRFCHEDTRFTATEASVSVSIAPYAPCRLLQGPPMRRGVLQCLQDPPGRVHPAEQAPQGALRRRNSLAIYITGHLLQAHSHCLMLVSKM